jgi:hypothetical protein
VLLLGELVLQCTMLSEILGVKKALGFGVQRERERETERENSEKSEKTVKQG